MNNQGQPIAPEDLPRVFDVAHRGVGERERAPDGLGLGLYICREIVRAHNGSIQVRSDWQTGTTFTVNIPRVPNV